MTWLHSGNLLPQVPTKQCNYVLSRGLDYSHTRMQFKLTFFILCCLHFPDEVCVNPMISYTDSCNCSDSSDIELSDEWVGKKSPKLSRGNRSPKICIFRLSDNMRIKSLFSLNCRFADIFVPFAALC